MGLSVSWRHYIDIMASIEYGFCVNSMKYWRQHLWLVRCGKTLAIGRIRLATGGILPVHRRKCSLTGIGNDFDGRRNGSRPCSSESRLRSIRRWRGRLNGIPESE